MKIPVVFKNFKISSQLSLKASQPQQSASSQIGEHASPLRIETPQKYLTPEKERNKSDDYEGGELQSSVFKERLP